MVLYSKNIQILYMALLHAFGYKKIKLNPISPTFFANIAKILNIDIEYVDSKFDFSSSADIIHNFFETFIPKSDIVFQNFGENIGEAKVFVKKYKNCIKAEFFDKEIFEKTKLFLNGGIKKAKLWNFDVISLGIKDIAKPCDVENLDEQIKNSNEMVKYFNEKFQNSPYFDILNIGNKTLKKSYPILLKPSLYCPKEDIYQELLNKKIDVKVRFKPLYKITLFKSKSLPTCEELYKAVLILPLKEDIDDDVLKIFEKYRYRGCIF
ncbi:DegT/DnrJ/EryC1/StrS family aminotransferase [Nitrosophilus kaiyonis]|uniref:DegT/DnrJ/EryC1/StrS family aminotransferase n=1 Tax=Nitrosophilus kaiyonis TaxID=2930200 RepID=UPI002492BD3B|nr:DegT/DnrJ/EryC1/StrS family aminotransferase [Nitrosophilus kaiyonis]